ncbi:MAG: hypothetical protein GY826_29215, partial [Fuerstiella sp.]|nr:hypothetical protein [Fuerstiella sp.]
MATADFDSEAPLPELDADHPDESIDYIQQMLVQIGPVELLQSRRSDDPASEVAEDVQEDSEGWIDGQLVNEFRTIEQLLDSEAQIDDVCVNVARGIVDSEPTVELPVDEPDSAHAAQQVLDFVNDETNECAEQVLLPISGCTAATPACLDQKEDHDSGSNSAVHLEGPRLSALPIEIDDVDLIVRPTVSADASTSADITSVDSPPTISADRASVSDGPPGGTVFTSRQADPLPGNVQRLVEDTNETARIGSREDGYAPHLLQQARDRVVSIVPSREMLRPAAGAESIALPLPEPLHDADTRKKQGVRSLPRLSTICDLAGAEHEDGEPKDAGQSAEPRFARLFTRLR